MQISCSQCAFVTRIDEALLPAGGMEGLCPCCRSSVPLGGWSATKPQSEEPLAETVLPPVAADFAEIDLPEEGRVSLISIIALIMLVDSTLSLIGRVPGLAGALGEGSGLTFHQQAKYLYDTLMAAGFFISVFGLVARKNWARIAFVWLLGLGLAEGLYLLAYQHAVISELERNMNEGFPELKGGQNARMIGCLLYAFFIVKLNSRTAKARFS
jgi:hypothetical protein